MVFDTTERSVQDAAPIELYKFTGTYNTYRMTSHAQDISNSDGLYVADVPQRGKIVQTSQEDRNAALEVTLRANHPMVTEYAINIAPPSLLLQVFRIHPFSPDDTLLMWQGQVVSWSIRGRMATLKAPSIFGYLFEGALPWPKYQAPCNHVLGDARCGVDLTLPENSLDTTVTAIDGPVITVDTNTFTPEDTAAGEFIFPTGGERRMIITSSGQDFTVSSPFAGLSVGDAVQIRRGCNHALNGDCRNKFNNVIRFGGFPYVPDRNPFSGRI